ncbi:MAG TPA: ABC transporter permease subunit [Thermoanaerobaculia bacterium]|jgi:ABC-type transport system involved in multi-copper enzyme maturation permease subunit|nr:ABC transporter permease subunit [Thermoanaerobaculia bacterium]
MKVLAANIEDVMREAAARWTLLAYFFLSSLFIIIFASAINLDIVDGALAGAKLFGQEVDTGNSEISIEKLVLGFETGFSVFLYFICTFLAIFATAHLVPRMQEKGTIDLYLSRPVSRVKLLFSRYIAGLILAFSNVVYLVGTIWLIVWWKTGVANPRFLLGGTIIFLVIAVLLAFAFLIGVITSSTAVSIMTTYGLFFFGLMLAAHDKIAAAVSKEWQAWTIETLYWVFPKTAELGQAVVAFVGGSELPERVLRVLTPAPFLTTAAFGAVCLVLASWLFTRKEF